MIIREESDESLFYDFTPVSMISDRGDFYFRDWMNSLSVGPLRLSGSGARQTRRFGKRPVPGILAVPCQGKIGAERRAGLLLCMKPPDA